MQKVRNRLMMGTEKMKELVIAPIPIVISTIISCNIMRIQAMKIEKLVKNRNFELFLCIIGHILHIYATQTGNWWLSSG